jgi:hypothetical protein
MKTILTTLALLLTVSSAQPQEGTLGQSVFGLNSGAKLSETCNGGICTFVFQGTGTSNIMGRISWTATIVQDFNVTPCNTARAEITLVGATGSIIVSDACGIVCPGVGVGSPNTIQSVWNVTGGTGEFTGIAGSGTTQGTIDGPGPVVRLNGFLSF